MRVRARVRVRVRVSVRVRFCVRRSARSMSGSWVVLRSVRRTRNAAGHGTQLRMAWNANQPNLFIPGPGIVFQQQVKYLRWRASMEMCCLDNLGREVWDRVKTSLHGMF